MRLYQEFPTSIQVWRDDGQEAKRREADGPRITRNVKRLGRFSSHVRLPGGPRRGVVPDRCNASGSAVAACHGTTAWARQAARAVEGSVAAVPHALAGSPRAPCMPAPRVARFAPLV